MKKVELITYSRPIFDQLWPEADPIYYVEWREDNGPICTGIVHAPAGRTEAELLALITSGQVSR